MPTILWNAFLLTCLTGLSANVLCAQESPASSAEEVAPRPAVVSEQRVRKLLVPENEIDDFLEERSGYYSLNREDFEDKLADFKAGSGVSQPARIARAFLFGKLTASGRLSGELYLEVKNAQANAQSVTLTDVNVMLSEAVWLDTTGTEAENDSFSNPGSLADVPELQRALIGNDSNGNLRLVAASSGLLRLKWRFPELLDPADAELLVGKTIMIGFPQSTSLTMQIVAPVDLELDIDGCKVEQIAVDSDRLAATPVRPNEQAFLIHCGTNSSPSLRIRNVDKKQDADSLPRYEEQVAYVASAEGLSFKSVLKFESPQIASDALRLDVSNETVCQSVSVQNNEVPFQVYKKNNRSYILIQRDVVGIQEFDEIEVACFMPIRLGTNTNLPRVKVNSAKWLRGKGELEFSPDVEFASLGTVGVEATSRPVALGERAINLVAWEESWRASFSLRDIAERMSIDSVCVVNANSASMAADQHVLFATDSDGAYSVTATVSKYWILDSVSAVELGTEQESKKLIDYWDSTGIDKVNDRFFVQFSRPISADRPIVLRVKGHRFLADEAPLTLRNFNMLRITDIAGRNVTKNMHVCVRERASTRIEYGPGSLFPDQISIDSITPTLITQVGLTESDQVFELNSQESLATRLAVIKSSAQEFDASIATEFDVSRRRIRESTTIKLRPVAGQVRAVRLEAVGDVSGLKWEMARDDGGELLGSVDVNNEFQTESFVIRKLRGNEVAQANAGDDSVVTAPNQTVHSWELTFRRQLPPNFSLTASRVTKGVDEFVALRFRAPAARTESATFLAGSTSDMHVELRSSVHKSVPASQQERNKFQRLVGKIRCDRDKPAPVTLKAITNEASVAGFVERLSVAWRFDSRESVTVATWRIRNVATGQFVFRLPPNSKLQSVQLNGTSTDVDEINEGYLVRLSADAPSVVLEVVYVGEAPASKWFNSISQELPQADIPVVEVARSVLLGDGWVVAEDWRPMEYQATWVEELQNRLFGGLSPFLFSKRNGREDHVGFSFAPTTQEKMLAFGRGNLSEVGSEINSSQGDLRSEWWSESDSVLTLSGDDSHRMLVNAKRLSIVRWLLMITSFCFSMTAIFNRRRLQILVAGIFLACCFVVPLLFSPLLAAAFWGIVVAMLVRALQAALFGEPESETVDENRTELMQDAATVVGGVIVLLCCLSASHLSAQEPDAESGNRRTYHDVVVPIDKDGKVSGNVVYLPKDLYSMLIRQQNSDPSLQTTATILSSALYEAKMSRNEFTGEPRVDNITATIEFRAEGSGESVVLPFDTRSVLVNRDSVRLDSSKSKMSLAEDGRGFVLNAGEAGQHELVFEFLPTTTNSGEWTAFNFAVPVIHDSRFTMHVESGLRGYRIESELTGSTELNSQGDIELVPGPSGRIAIRWSNDAQAGSVRKNENGDQLMTVELGRKDVHFDYMWSRDLKLGELEESFVVAIDSDLELIEDRSSQVLSQLTDASGQTTYTFACERSETALHAMARFRRSGTSFGNLTMPDVHTPQAHMRTNLLAMMRAPSLLIEPVGDSRMLLSDSLDTFVQLWNRWGEIDDAQISQVFRVDDATPTLAWKVSPERGRRTVNVDVQLDTDISGSEFTSRIDLKFGDVPGNIAKFSLPRGYTISKVEVASQTIPESHTMLARNECTVMFSSPQQAVQLLVSGTAKSRQALPFPLFQFEEAEQTDHHFVLRRAQNCIVNVKPSNLWLAIEADRGRKLSDGLRLVGAWNAAQRGSGRETNEANEKANVSPASISIEGRVRSRGGSLVTSVRNLDGELFLDIDCFPMIDHAAEMDRIEVRLSGKLPGVIVASEEGKVTLSKSPFSEESLVVFTPQQPLQSGARVTLQSGPIQVGSRLPVVTWTNFSRNDHVWLRLVRELDNPAVAWKLTNLIDVGKQKIKSLTNEVRDLLTEDGYRALRPSRSKPVIELSIADDRQKELVVPLQLTTIQWNGGVNWLGSCALDLSATDSAMLVFRHEDNLKVVDVRLEGSTTQFHDADERCEVAIPASDFPRKLVLSIQGQTTQSNSTGLTRIRFDGLSLASHPVSETFMRVTVPKSIASTSSDVVIGSGVELKTLEAVAVSQLVALTSLGPELPRRGNDSRIDHAVWMRNLQRRVDRLLDVARNGQLSDFDRSRLNEANSRLALLINQSDDLQANADAGIEFRSIGQMDEELTELMSPAAAAASIAYVWRVEDESRFFTIAVKSLRRSSSQNRQWLWLIAAGSLIFAAAFSRKQSWDVLRRIGPQASLVALALLGWTWTMFFDPPIIGWLMGVAALVIGIRSMFRNRILRRQQAAIVKARRVSRQAR